MIQFLHNLPYVKRLIARFRALDARLHGHAVTLESLAARIDALELQVREISHNYREISDNYTEFTTSGLRDILEHWEQRVRDDFDIDRTQSIQELRDEIARLRSALERRSERTASLDDGVTH
jgi:predicted RNase H-like nuclease (RuvC/YqgF family)